MDMGQSTLCMIFQCRRKRVSREIAQVIQRTSGGMPLAPRNTAPDFDPGKIFRIAYVISYGISEIYRDIIAEIIVVFNSQLLELSDLRSIFRRYTIFLTGEIQLQGRYSVAGHTSFRPPNKRRPDTPYKSGMFRCRYYFQRSRTRKTKGSSGYYNIITISYESSLVLNKFFILPQTIPDYCATNSVIAVPLQPPGQ